MSRLNWGRILSGGIIAAIVAFVSDGLLHEQVVAADWKAVYENLRIVPPPHSNTAFAYFAVFELGRGLISIFLYATMRPHFGPGPKTAALAGVAAWIAFSVAGPAQFIPLGFFSNALWLKVGAFQLVTSIVAAIAGAALYKDAAKPAASPGG